MKPRACTQDSSQTLHSHTYKKPTVCMETLMRLSLDPPPGPIEGWSESPQMGRSRRGEVGDVPTFWRGLVAEQGHGLTGGWAGLRLLSLG